MKTLNSVYRTLPADPQALVLGSEAFPAYGDGLHDDTKNLQYALNTLKRRDNFGIVFLPEGKYLISDTVFIPKSIRLIGVGENRPEIILREHAPGYDVPHPENKSGGKEMIWFVDSPVEKPEDIHDANPGTFYSALSNVNVTIGAGNPYAIALRTHYAQHSFTSHLKIDAGGGFAGMYDAGNEMENVHFEGGEYGIVTTKCSPGWPYMAVDCSFSGQKKAGMYSRELGFTALRCDFKDEPKAIDGPDGFWDKIALEDCIFENISDTALTVHLEENAFTQWNLENIWCRNVPRLLMLHDSKKTIEAPAESYLVKRLTHGVILRDMQDDGKIDTVVEMEAISEFKPEIRVDVPLLPDTGSWVNVKDFGAAGDNETDDTEAIRRAVREAKVLYFPQGWYRVTDTIELQEDTVLIGLNPISTQLKLPENTEAFGGPGTAKPLVLSGRGANVVNGIGIDTGARNPRACGLKWLASEDSYVNDVKFIGGHGSMNRDGSYVPAYNRTRTADYDPAKRWDVQYWSFWVTEGGGGVIKDVWSASPYAAAGFRADKTGTRGRIYCMSVEHHVRNGVKFNNVSNWKVYALQTEEEVAESQHCQPLEITDCRDMSIVTYYSFRVIWLPNPYPAAIRTDRNDRVRFLNLHNYTQVKYTLTYEIIDSNTGSKVRPWQIAYLEQKKAGEMHFPALSEDTPKLLYDGFEFADGACTDAEGNLYFCDGRWNRIFRIDAASGQLRLIRDVPLRPLSLFVDTAGNLIVISEFRYPAEATKNGERMRFEKPADAAGTSYGDWYISDAVTVPYAIDPMDPENTMNLLKKVPTASLHAPAQALHPANRWRDDNSYLTASFTEPEYCYVAPDGVTVIPEFYDLIRSNTLLAAVPGKKFLAVDEYYKRVIESDVKENGCLENPRVFCEHGEYSVAVSEETGRVYVAEGHILVYDTDGNYLETIRTPKRAGTLAIGGKDKDVLFVTSEDSVYALKIG